MKKARYHGRLRQWLSLFFMLALPHSSFAELMGLDSIDLTPSQQCPPWSNVHQPTVEWKGDEALAPLYLTADRVTMADHGNYVLDGDVVIQQAGQTLRTESATYQQNTSQVFAEGDVGFQDGAFSLTSRDAVFSLNQKQGEFNQAEFFMTDINGRGLAETIAVDSPELIRLKTARYTSCRPGNDDWYLSSPEIKLDKKNAIGSARRVVLTFKQVPFFYFPYLSFPIDDQRKSGLLSPRITNSSRSGFQISVPYYWNIAPQYDATLTPVYMAKRGLQLKNELRYLSRFGGGSLQADFLPKDKIYGGSRALYNYKHDGSIAKNWNLVVRFNQVSDTDYLEDLGGSLASSSARYVERRLDLSYGGNMGRFKIRLQNHQVVDKNLADSSRPYRRLPQLIYDLPQQKFGPIKFNFQSELVRFERAESINATRFDLQPKISGLFGRQAGFFKPQLTLRHTAYALGGAVVDEAEKQPVRTVPIVSLDSGLFFERDTAWGKKPLLHTLEPRFFYLNVPFRSQSELPVFDTAVPSFNFLQLFQTNRFSGSDRIGDANQLTVALTSRLLDANNGQEYFQARIGQIQYFRDRFVQLSGVSMETVSQSDTIGEIKFRLNNHWNGKTELHWEPETDSLYKKTVRLQYKPSQRHVLNFGYRFENKRQKQIDLSFFWQFSSKWSAVGRWNYSQYESRLLESLAGLEYSSCCWAVRVLSQRFLVDSLKDEYDESISLQLELKGLSAIGQDIRQILERGILGYDE
ncbi:MAG: LPS assembly protein LptD [Gammaproteobacteria bacterium]|nr:LPS assembly protein LptD [Gammaproteobacteria bacterium]